MSINNPTSDSDAESDPNNADTELTFDTAPRYRFDDIDGLDTECGQLQTVADALANNAPIKTHSVLIHGPRGNGKSRLAEALCGELHEEGFNIGWYNDFEEADSDESELVSQVLRQTVDSAPSVLVLDQFAGINTGILLRQLRDELTAVNTEGEQVLVVATATPNILASNTPTCFELSIALENPDHSRVGRLLERYVAEFAEAQDAEVTIDTTDEELREAGAGLNAAELRLGTKYAFQHGCTGANGGEACLTTDLLIETLSSVQDNRPDSTPFPHNTEESEDNQLVTETGVSFSDIGGLDEVKSELQGAVEFPTQFEEVYESCGLSAPGILLHGDPGNGKTMLAKALANEYDRSFIPVNGPELKNKYVGDTERNIREVFETARRRAPSVVFFDEIDTLAANRDAVSNSHEISFTNTLLAELDGFRDTADVLVVAATNRKKALDPAILREGRLGRQIHVPAPDYEATKAIIETHTAEFPLADEVTPEWVATELPAGIRAATVTGICDHALRWHAMNRKQNGGSDLEKLEVTRADIRAAIEEYPADIGDGPGRGSSGFY